MADRLGPVAQDQANYHGLLFGVFGYAVEQGYLATHPCARTAPKRSRIRQSQADLRFLTEAESATAARLAGEDGDLLRVAVGTGMRFGELTALWVPDVDLAHRSVPVNKAWKRDGEDDARRRRPGCDDHWVARTRCVATTSETPRRRSLGGRSPCRRRSSWSSPHD